MLLNCRLARAGGGAGAGGGTAGGASAFTTPVATWAASVFGGGGEGVTICLGGASLTITPRGGGTGGGAITTGSLLRPCGNACDPGVTPPGRVVAPPAGERVGCGDVREARNSLIDVIV